MFEVVTAGNRHVFDSFEYAIHLLAPMCEHCGCRIVGHGIEVREAWYWTMAIAASRSGTEVKRAQPLATSRRLVSHRAAQGRDSSLIDWG